MNGLATWKQAVTHLPGTVRRACEGAGWSPDDVDLFIFHQANLQIITYVMAKMGVPLSRTYTNVQDDRQHRGGIDPDRAWPMRSGGAPQPRASGSVLAGVGAGFTFGATCLGLGRLRAA